MALGRSGGVAVALVARGERQVDPELGTLAGRRVDRDAAAARPRGPAK